MQVLESSSYSLWKEILYRCEPKEVVICSRVNKLWNRIASEEEMYQSLINRRFPCYDLHSNRTIKDQYQSLECIAFNLKNGRFTQSSSKDVYSVLSLGGQFTPNQKQMIGLNEGNQRIDVIDVEGSSLENGILISRSFRPSTPNQKF